MPFSDSSDTEVAAVAAMEEVGKDRDGVESGARVDMTAPPRFRRRLGRLIWRRWLRRDLWII